MSDSEKYAAREKYWDECNADEHVERLRAELHRLNQVVERMDATILQLQNHTHHELSGQLLVPFNDGMRNNLPRYRSFKLEHGKP